MRGSHSGAGTAGGDGGLAGGVSSSGSSSSSRALLPELRRLYLKLCFVPSAALSALLGTPPLTGDLSHQQQQQQQHQHQQQQNVTDSSSSGGGNSGGSRDGCGVQLGAPPALEVLSVTGEGVLRGEASEAWCWWLQALGQLRGLQVGG